MAEPDRLVHPVRQWILDGIHDLPALTDVVSRILEATEREGSSSSDVERLVSTDTALAAKILRVVNSAYYGLPGQVSSLNQAVVILGMQQIRNLVLSISALSLLRGRTPELRKVQGAFWIHSLATAACAQLIARRKRLPVREIERAYIGGLLHEIGRLFLFNNAAETYLEAIDRASQEHVPLETVEVDLLGVRHDEVGGELARAWHFPAGLTRAIEEHEGPFGNQPDAVVFAVHAADRLTANHYASYFDIPVPKMESRVVHWLDLEENEVSEVLTETDRRLREAQDLYGLVSE